MDIPAFYSAFRGGEVMTAPVRIQGSEISFASEPARLAYSADGSEDRMPIAVIDVKGLDKRKLDDRLLTGMKFPGSDVWFMTCIEDIEDVFDCFMGDIVKVLVPYHMTRNDLVMKEVYDMSDNCIPVVFVSGGMAVCRGAATKDLKDALCGLTETGFTEIAVFDTDNTLRPEDWSSLSGRSGGIIPCVRDRNRIPEDAVFYNVIYGFS